MTGFTYKSYSFIDKDPLIDEIRTVYEASGWSYKQVEEHSGVTAQTLRNWLDGETRRPQAATANAVLRSLGYKLGVIPLGQAVAVVPTPPAQPSMRHVVQMTKYKRGAK
jgi:transcriptional regulator with XRE-family HTH domain